jgi:hypothetical protein
LTCDRYTLRGGALQQLKAVPAHFAGAAIGPEPGSRITHSC